MTPQQLKAMNLALEALKDLQLCTDDYYDCSHEASKKGDDAITAIKEALAEHAMRETQRLGQEIEQEPTCPECKAEVLYECVACSSNNYPPPQRTEQEQCSYPDCKCPTESPCLKGLAQPEQETVAWPCLIDSADFSENTITLVMQCEDYKVSAGTHWLSATPPKVTK